MTTKDPKGRAEPGFSRHLFICTNAREDGHVRGSCAAKGGLEIRQAFVRVLADQGIKDGVRANKSGCLDFCESGPCVVVYPDAVWYTIDDIERDVLDIVTEHIVGGEPVERCRLRLE